MTEHHDAYSISYNKDQIVRSAMRIDDDDLTFKLAPAQC